MYTYSLYSLMFRLSGYAIIMSPLGNSTCGFGVNIWLMIATFVLGAVLVVSGLNFSSEYRVNNGIPFGTVLVVLGLNFISECRVNNDMHSS